MSLFVIPIVFFLGAVSGGVLIWHWRGRRGTDGVLNRRQKWKLVLATALLTTLSLAAVGYGLIHTRFRTTQAKQETVGQAVSDYRKAQGAAPKKSNGKAPPGGVYQYQGSGFYELTVPVLGRERRVLPKTIPAVLLAEGDCWELNLRFFKQHHRKARYCQDPKAGLRVVWIKNKNEFFSMKNDSHSTCTPDVMVRPGAQPGRQWNQDCKPGKVNPHFGAPKVTVVVRYLGRESLTIGTRATQAHHLRRTLTLSGIQTGIIVQNIWYATDSGMLLKLRMKGEGKGVAKYVSDYQLTLTSLSPTS